MGCAKYLRIKAVGVKKKKGKRGRTTVKVGKLKKYKTPKVK